MDKIYTQAPALLGEIAKVHLTEPIGGDQLHSDFVHSPDTPAILKGMDEILEDYGTRRDIPASLPNTARMKPHVGRVATIAERLRARGSEADKAYGMYVRGLAMMRDQMLRADKADASDPDPKLELGHLEGAPAADRIAAAVLWMTGVLARVGAHESRTPVPPEISYDVMWRSLLEVAASNPNKHKDNPILMAAKRFSWFEATDNNGDHLFSEEIRHAVNAI